MKYQTHDKRHLLSQGLYTLSLVFLALGLFSLGWAVWPTPLDGVQYTIPAGLLAGAPGDMAYESLSEYALEITWPRWIRRNEAGALHLSLIDLDPLPADFADASQVVLAEPALYPLLLDPPSGVQAGLGDDQTLHIRWSVSGDQPGVYPGKLYVSFGFFDPEADVLTAVPVAVVDLEMRVIELWGLPPGLVIWLGFVGLVLWGGLFLLGRAVAGR